jgi:hypothetical protein
MTGAKAQVVVVVVIEVGKIIQAPLLQPLGQLY